MFYIGCLSLTKGHGWDKRFEILQNNVDSAAPESVIIITYVDIILDDFIIKSNLNQVLLYLVLLIDICI